MQEKKIESVGAAAGERLLGCRTQIACVLARFSESRTGEAGKPLRAIALPMIEVVSNRADQAIAVARNPIQRAPEQRIGFARSVNIGGEKGPNSPFICEMDEIDEVLIGQRFTEMHESPRAPHSKSGSSQLHRHRNGNHRTITLAPHRSQTRSRDVKVLRRAIAFDWKDTRCHVRAAKGKKAGEAKIDYGWVWEIPKELPKNDWSLRPRDRSYLASPPASPLLRGPLPRSTR